MQDVSLASSKEMRCTRARLHYHLRRATTWFQSAFPFSPSLNSPLHHSISCTTRKGSWLVARSTNKHNTHHRLSVCIYVSCDPLLPQLLVGTATLITSESMSRAESRQKSVTQGLPCPSVVSRLGRSSEVQFTRKALQFAAGGISRLAFKL